MRGEWVDLFDVWKGVVGLYVLYEVLRKMLGEYGEPSRYALYATAFFLFLFVGFGWALTPDDTSLWGQLRGVLNGFFAGLAVSVGLIALAGWWAFPVPWVDDTTEAFFLYMLFVQAITDYISLRVEIIIGGFVFLRALWFYVEIAGNNLPLLAVFLLIVVLALFRKEISILLAIPVVTYLEWFMIHAPRHELIWGYAFVVGVIIGLIDNRVLRRTAEGDVLITTNVFIALGSLGMLAYLAQFVLGEFFTQKEWGEYVYPMGPPTFLAALGYWWLYTHWLAAMNL